MTKRLASTRRAGLGRVRTLLQEGQQAADGDDQRRCPGSGQLPWTNRLRDAGRRRLRDAGMAGHQGMTRLRDAGMTTAEYAIGTLAACGFAALLVTILRGGVVQGLLLAIIKRALALGG
jgi:hypothetical protein